LKEEKPSKKSELLVIEAVAKQLSNTAAVCRKCYIHPAVISGYHYGSLRDGSASVSHRVSGIWMAVGRVRRLLTHSPDAGLARWSGARYARVSALLRHSLSRAISIDDPSLLEIPSESEFERTR